MTESHKIKITKDHLKLLERMYVGWQDCEYGAPEIDPKRPYGNSSVEYDIAEILKWKVKDDVLTEEQEEKAAEVHREMQYVLQVLVQHPKGIKPGTYENVEAENYGNRWVRKK